MSGKSIDLPASLQARPQAAHRRRTIRLAIRIVLALLIAWLWFKSTRLAILAIDLNRRARLLKQEALALSDSQDILGSVAHLRSEVDDIRSLVSDIRVTLWPFEYPLKGLGWLPVVGRDIAAAPRLVEIADLLLAASHDLDVAYSPLIEKVAGGGGASGNALDLLTEAAQVNGQALADARAKVNAAIAVRQQIGDAAALDPRLQDLMVDVDRILVTLDQGLSAAEAAPYLLGVDRPQHVLILIQNADELRATGGFITASAYIVIDRGHLSKPVVMSSSNPLLDRDDRFQYQEPPLPFSKYMHLQRWYFRDANWWADFPTSASKATGLYTAAMDAPVDTVVAINQYTLRSLIGVVGPIDLGDGTVITRDNAIVALQDMWSQSLAEKGSEGRKAFIERLAPLLMSKMLASKDAGTLVRAWGAQKTISQRRDLMIYSTDAPIQALSERLGFDGSIPAEKGDYLYALDTNIGWNKLDLVVRRAMTYHIDLTNLAQPSAQLQMTYRNPSRGRFVGPACLTGKRPPTTYTDRADDCYADYIRLYLPDDTQLVASPTFDYPGSYVGKPAPDDARVFPLPGERNKAVFGALMVVRSQRKQVLDFTYTLSPQEIFHATPDGELIYTLLIQKQPGRQAFPMIVKIDLPQGISASSVAPKPTSRNGAALTYELSADADIRIRIVLPVGMQQIQQLGLDAGVEALDSSPRVAPTDVPLPTALPGTVNPLSPAATPTP